MTWQRCHSLLTTWRDRSDKKVGKLFEGYLRGCCNDIGKRWKGRNWRQREWGDLKEFLQQDGSEENEEKSWVKVFILEHLVNGVSIRSNEKGDSGILNEACRDNGFTVGPVEVQVL